MKVGILILLDIYILIWTIVDNFRHYYTIKGQIPGEMQNRVGWHTAAAAEVGFMIAFITWALLPIMYGVEIHILLIMFQMICVYWLVHDIGINLMLKKGAFYIGTTDIVDKFIRKILKEKVFWVYHIFKVILIIVLTILIFTVNCLMPI